MAALAATTVWLGQGGGSAAHEAADSPEETAPREVRRVAFAAEDCRKIVTRHVPDADVAYQPGVDVRGKPVTPADIQAYAALELPKRIVVDVLIPLRDHLGVGAPPGTADSEIRLGAVTVELASGRLFFDRRPLSDPVAHAIIEACERIIEEGQSE